MGMFQWYTNRALWCCLRTVSHRTPNRTLMLIFLYQIMIFCFQKINFWYQKISTNFWYQKMIFWYQKINFWYQKIHEFLILENRTYFLTSENDFLISGINFWYQKIIFWYQKLYFDIRNYFLISEISIFWYQKIKFLISENTWISDIRKSYLFSYFRKWFSDIRN